MLEAQQSEHATASLLVIRSSRPTPTRPTAALPSSCSPTSIRRTTEKRDACQRQVAGAVDLEETALVLMFTVRPRQNTRTSVRTGKAKEEGRGGRVELKRRGRAVEKMSVRRMSSTHTLEASIYPSWGTLSSSTRQSMKVWFLPMVPSSRNART